MFTHYHAKHVNTFSKLVSRTRVHTVYLPISNSENSISYVKEIEGIATMHDIDVIKFEYGSSVEFQGCEVTVFSPIEIKRSTHPVINLSVTAKGTDVLYLGSSFSETDFEYQNLAHDAEYILFGQHNPVPKKEFKIDTNALTVYASEKHASLSKDTGIDKIMQENDLYEILLK